MISGDYHFKYYVTNSLDKNESIYFMNLNLRNCVSIYNGPVGWTNLL